MTDKKLVFLLAVAAGAVVRSIEGRAASAAAQTVAYAGTVPDRGLEGLDISEAAEEYVDYCLQGAISTPGSIPEPVWCRR